MRASWMFPVPRPVAQAPVPCSLWHAQTGAWGSGCSHNESSESSTDGIGALLVWTVCDFFAKQRIFLGGNRASHDPGRRNGGVMRNPNYTYADTRQPSPGDEGQQESPHVSI